MDTRSADAIDRFEVEVAVARQFGHATVQRWEAIDLGHGRGGNVTTFSVHRVRGYARTPGGDVAWSQIRKVLVRPPAAAEQDIGHWNYWRREPLLLGSDRLSDLPAGVSAPAVRLIVDGADRVTVWMEDAGVESDGRWGNRQLARVAHRLGRLAGRFLDHPPTAAWLSHDLIGQWISNLPTYAPLLHDNDSSGWSDPRIRGVYRGGRAGPVATLLGNASAAWTGLEPRSTTLCHRDCGLENLRLRSPRAQLVLFDWALAGPGPVGEDLGLLLASAARQNLRDPLRLGRRLLGNYLDGIASTHGVGAVPARTVWRTAVAAAALRETIFAAAALSSALTDGPSSPDRFARFAAEAPTIEALASEAIRLAHRDR